MFLEPEDGPRPAPFKHSVYNTGVPVAWLISEAYAAERRAAIDMSRAQAPMPGMPGPVESATTTHVTAADAGGNLVAMTQTINQS